MAGFIDAPCCNFNCAKYRALLLKPYTILNWEKSQSRSKYGLVIAILTTSGILMFEDFKCTDSDKDKYINQDSVNLLRKHKATSNDFCD